MYMIGKQPSEKKEEKRKRLRVQGFDSLKVSELLSQVVGKWTGRMNQRAGCVRSRQDHPPRPPPLPLCEGGSAYCACAEG